MDFSGKKNVDILGKMDSFLSILNSFKILNFVTICRAASPRPIAEAVLAFI